MITRAQAEALLTLAESLEACERLDVVMFVGHGRAIFSSASERLEVTAERYGDVYGECIRKALEAHLKD